MSNSANLTSTAMVDSLAENVDECPQVGIQKIYSMPA